MPRINNINTLQADTGTKGVVSGRIPATTANTRKTNEAQLVKSGYSPVAVRSAFSGQSLESSPNSQPTASTGGSGSGGSGSYSAPNYYNDLMAAFMEQNEAGRNAALEAILKNLDAVKGTYEGQIRKVMADYDSLVDQNEVKKERAKRVIRENQANRGQLDTGLGRQEQLNMNLGYDNITSNLKQAKEEAVNEIYNLIAQAEADANTNKANVNNTYANALLQYRIANS